MGKKMTLKLATSPRILIVVHGRVVFTTYYGGVWLTKYSFVVKIGEYIVLLCTSWVLIRVVLRLIAYRRLLAKSLADELLVASPTNSCLAD